MTLGTTLSVLDPSLYIPDLKARKRDAALAELAELAQRQGVVRGASLLLDLLLLRERLGTTAVGKGVALPAARSLTVERPQLVIARSRRGIDWSAFDGEPVSLVLLALSPAESSDAAHHAFVARGAAVARLQRNRQKLLEAPNVETVMTVLREVTA
ncbi:MAG: PTS sugar transporter subunit IIA [Candidatus Eisenbacteria bacterium]|uniref:PTS sugar transporter subunit IIA n=1 Tax=Eiseniibacteriota bacterium TaxID=2212470 RepID=A0A9D6QM24_UNCEI|nr:PTS sugar transporter subunit IIA [Candidatus Eisenbacteria bacterium]MBI3539303.1 PTS sugar transporter subunit IIA [Candidatus Eisenbacteria bacterium]